MQRFDPNKLRALRKAAGLSRKELAYAIGRSHFTVADYEHGQTRTKPYTPSIPVLLRIARVLGCLLEDFFIEVDEPVGELHTDRDEQALPPHPFLSAGDARESAAHTGGAA